MTPQELVERVIHSASLEGQEVSSSAQQVMIDEINQYIKEKKMKIMTIPREQLRRVLKDYKKIFNSVQWVERNQAEIDTSVIQIIPINVIVKGEKIFTYIRGKSGGEDRLHSKVSCSIGGHIDYTPAAPEALFTQSMMRELREEIGISPAQIVKNEFKFCLYDPSNEVGKVHLAIVFLTEVKDGVQFKLEDCIENGAFRTIDEIYALGYEFESWTTIIMNSLFGDRKFEGLPEDWDLKVDSTEEQIVENIGEEGAITDSERYKTVLQETIDFVENKDKKMSFKEYKEAKNDFNQS